MKDDGTNNAPNSSNEFGWNGLPNEIKSMITIHAINDIDAWRSKSTVDSLRHTSKDFRYQTDVRPIKQYRELLKGNGLVSDDVVKKTFLEKEFTPTYLDRPHIGHELAALSEILQFQSPEMRSQIFSVVSGKGIDERMLGYAHLIDNASLLKPHEVTQMEREALETFDNPIFGSNIANYSAAEILVRGYDHLTDSTHAVVDKIIHNENAVYCRANFCNAIIYSRPSMLGDPNFRELVKETLSDIEDPHGALEELSSYVDPKSQSDIDFVMEQSLFYIGRPSVEGPNHALNAPARAIAKLFQSKLVRRVHKNMTYDMIRSGSKEGLALIEASKVYSQAVREKISLDPSESKKLRGILEKTSNLPEDFGRIQKVQYAAASASRQMNEARAMLMNSIADRSDRGR